MNRESYIGELRKEVSVLEDLMKHPGWEVLKTAAEKHNTVRLNEILKPLGEGITAERQEFLKGEMSGITTIINLPQAGVQSGKAKIEDLMIQQQQDEGEDDGN